MADISKLVLHRVRDKKKLDVFDAMVEDGIAYSQGIDGTNTITITLHDPDWVLLTSGWFDVNTDGRMDAIDVQVAGVWYRVQQASPSDFNLSLICENRNIAYLREKFGRDAVSRNTWTRAQFAQDLVKRVKKVKIGFYSRELKVKQPIAKGETDATTGATGDDDSKDSGNAGARITDAPSGFSNNQKIFAQYCSAECGLDARVIGAWMMKEFGGAERTSRPDAPYNFMSVGFTTGGDTAQSKNEVFGRPSTAGTYTGKFLKGETSPHASQKIQDILKTVDDPIEKQVRAIIDSDWADSHYRRDYGGFTRLARSFAVTGDGSVDSSTDTSKTVAKSYQYQVAKTEDYWTALQRLATEVNWRCFLHRGVVYFMDDYQLLRGKPQWRPLKRTDNHVQTMTFEWDQRGKFPQEMSVSIIMDRGEVSPGDVIEVTEAGPANGRWIISQIEGSFFNPVVSLTLVQPTADKKEPAHENESVDSSTGEAGGSSSGVAAMYERAKEISEQNLPYRWGGGHQHAGSPSGGGYDCSGYVAACLVAGGYYEKGAGVPRSDHLGNMYKSGRGTEATIWSNASHVFLVFEKENDRADTSAQGGDKNGSKGPHVRGRAGRSTAGFNPSDPTQKR